MPDYRDLLRAAREGTTPDPATLARLEAVARGERRRPPPHRRPAVWAGAAAAGLAAAALWLALLPAPRVDRPLTHAGAVALGARVNVVADGEGRVTGDGQDMTLAWESGTLSVEVEPNQGVKLAVTSPEATVRVVGTGFTVTRDALGTAVAVRHGKVAVTCARGDEHLLTADQSATCAPAHAAAALARVLALRATATPAALLQEIDAALALPDARGPAAAELHVLRAGALLDTGDAPGALAEAEAALAAPDVTRADELHRLAARLRLRAGDCAGALPHLRALEAAGTLGDDAPALAGCAPTP